MVFLDEQRRMDMHVLVIEGDELIAQRLTRHLTGTGILVQVAANWEEGCMFATTYPYDAIVLSADLPDWSGLDALCHLRRKGVRTPVVVMGWRDEVAEKVRFLNAGADEYLPMPWHNEELIARLNALVRRSCGHAQSLLTVGELSINLTLPHIVVHKDRRITLPRKQWLLLKALMLRPGTVLSREQLISYVYNDPSDVESTRIIDVYVFRLRKLFGDDLKHGLIRAHCGAGYSISAPDPEQLPALQQKKAAG